MSLLTTLLASLVALEHLFIMYLETIATHSKQTSKAFGMPIEELERPSVTVLFKNIGIYNGLIAVGLIYGIVTGNLEITSLFVVSVIAAASYGAATSNVLILLKQGGPAILTLLSILFFH